MGAEFGGQSVTNKQRIGIESVWRKAEFAELVLPQANEALRTQLIGDEAKRGLLVTLLAAVVSARSWIVFGQPAIETAGLLAQPL